MRTVPKAIYLRDTFVNNNDLAYNFAEMNNK